MDLKCCLSFDIGGTFIKYALIDNSGKIYEKGKFETPKGKTKETIPQALCEMVEKFKDKVELSCIGVSTAGQVDINNASIYFAVDTIPEYTGTDFRTTVGEKFNLPIFVDNDVNSAAAGELWIGSGRDINNFLCMTLGTGVGGAIVVDRKVYRGENNSAGEVGHFIVVKDGDKCTCGKNGCYERYASTSSLIRMYKDELVKNNLSFDESYNGEYIVDLYYKGDKIATKVYEEFLDNVAYGIANLTHILDPGVIIIGGGISSQGDPFFNELNNRFKKYVLKSYADRTVIKQASLVNDAGVIGAAFNAFSYVGII